MLELTKRDGSRYLTFVAAKQDDGREILSIMRNEFALSSRKIKSVKYADNGIYVDGERVNVRYRIKEGQCLQILLEDVTPSCECLLDYSIELNILYEDEDFLFIEKPAGAVCHPSQGHYADSLVNAACAVLRDRGEQASLHLLGRLDKDTSGIVGFAKNGFIQERMERQREQGLFEKQYLAITTGVPAERKGVLKSTLKEVPTEDGRLTYMVKGDENDKASETHYEVLNSNGAYAICRVIIKTGRTHQIRSHMSGIGCPLLGDNLYGGALDAGIERAALHAEKVSFIHPVTDMPISFSAQIPEDMKKIIYVIENNTKICDTV